MGSHGRQFTARSNWSDEGMWKRSDADQIDAVVMGAWIFHFYDHRGDVEAVSDWTRSRPLRRPSPR